MNKAYLWISWGLVLELIDIRIQSFDIFPDILGYLLILIGLGSVPSTNRFFGIARLAAGVQLIGAFVQLSGGSASITLTNTNTETSSISVLLLSSIFTVVELVMLFGICAGIKASAKAQGNWRLARSAGSSWRVNFVLGTIVLLLLPYQLNSQSNDYVLVLIALGFGFFIANLSVIIIVRRAGRELDKKNEDLNGHLEKNVDLLE